MATQVKFYSTTAASYSAIESKDAGGVYFVDGGELYKGTSRFGANKIYQLTSNYSIGDISGQIGGDIAIGDGWTKAWDGTSWVQIENNKQIQALISLMTASLVAGGAGSYITGITQDENGIVIAHAQAFPTLNLGATTKSGTSNGVTVSVTTQSGAVTGVQVAAPAYTATQVTKSDKDIGINVAVTTKNGQVTSVDVAADNTITPVAISASSGTFTDLTVTSTANFSVTNVSATTLTIGGSTVEQLADKQIAAISSVMKTSTSNGITVSVTTAGGSVSKVELNASAFGNVMRFRDVVTVLPSTNNKQGDIVVIKAGASSPLVQGQEYIWISTTTTGTDYWELIGDQNTYATKAYVDASVSSLKETKAQAGTAVVYSSYYVSATLSLYSNQSPILSFYVTPVSDTYSLSYSNQWGKLVTARALSGIYDKVYTSVVDTSTSISDINYSHRLVTTTAVSGYAVPFGTYGASTSNGVTISVSAVNSGGPKLSVSIIGLGTAASKNFTNAITSAGTSLPTESAVYAAISSAALVWLDANGSAIS